MHRSLSLAATLISLLAAQPSIAQNLSSGGGVASSGFQPPVQGVGPKQVRREAPPPGIPGSQARDRIAPRIDVPLDVPPTEALFDAINRGDIGSAREALNRGADLAGRNVLGMTPLDLSIDLARNDITFLLLSLRAEVETGRPSNGVAAAKAVPSTPQPRRTQASASAVRQTAVALTSPTAARQSAATRYAGALTTPAPDAGFLGFGGSGAP